MTTIHVLIAVAYIISMTAFLQQIAKKHGVLVVLTGIGHIVVSVVNGMQTAVMMSAMTFIVMVSMTIHSSPHRYSITHQRNKAPHSLASS